MTFRCSVTIKVLFVLLILHSRCKHIELKYHFITNLINDGDLFLLRIPGVENSTDMLTKIFTTTKLRLCIASTGLQES